MTDAGHRPRPAPESSTEPDPAPAAPEQGPRRPELSDAAVVSRSWGMAFATLISRITGFIRIVLLAAILGAALSSAFSVANQLPNLIAALVLEATFTAIFVPVLARAEKDDPDGGAAFVRRLVTLVTTLLLVTTIVSVAAAPALVRLMLGGDPQVNEPLTTAFAYLLLPQVLFYGLSSVFMAILNTRNIFGPPAWAPVLNNVVAIATLIVYLLVPGELSVDPVQMGNAKLLVLGIGTTLGVVAQCVVLLPAIRRERISLRPMWGIDDRIKRFGGMAAAMVLYVLISQIGLVVGNQIASSAAASGPAIYNYTWLVLQLPFGMIGVTVLTVVMPRLSRNAAADDIPAVLGDLSLATRLTMLTLIPIVAVMTVGGPAIGTALFAYGNFGQVDAGYLGMAITLSAFTLIPYALVLLQLRVFYAREKAWTPILIIVVITAVKIAGSLAAPHVTDDPQLVAGYLGMANGLGFLAGAVAGHLLLRAHLRPPGGRLYDLQVIRTVLVTLAAALVAAMLGHAADRLLRFEALTEHSGGAGSLLRLALLGLLMAPTIGAVLWAAKVPEAASALAFVKRRLGRASAPHQQTPTGPRSGVSEPGVSGAAQPLRPAPSSDPAPARRPLTYPEQSNSSAPGQRPDPLGGHRAPSAAVTGEGMRKGPAVSDKPTSGAAPGPDGTTTRISLSGSRPRPEPEADQPEPGPATARSAPVEPTGDDVEAEEFQPDVPEPGPRQTARPTVPPNGVAAAAPGVRPVAPPRRAEADKTPPKPAPDTSPAEDDVHLVPGAIVGDGRYRLLVCHGGPPPLQFWQALDIALDRQVALTFVDPDGTLSGEQVRGILDRTLKLSRIDMPGVARVLDVRATGTGGLVVSEWIRGGSLAEVAATSPSPIGGARAVQSLAAAAEVAHRSGVALSIDHPSRIRVSIEGDVALAFPATLPDASPDEDIRGIGAALYALLVNRWPLPEAGVPSGLAPADKDALGRPLEPRTIDRDIPFQISAAAAHAVQESGGIRSAPTLLNLLQQATAVADRTELLAPVDNEAEPEPVDDEEPAEDDPETAARRRKALIIGISAGAAIIIVALVLLATFLNRLFGDVGGGGGIRSDRLGLNPGTTTSGTAATTAPGELVKPVAATVFSPEGEPDAPDKARLAIDGDRTTVWPIDKYTDPVPFPYFKNGVGLILQLPRPTKIGEVGINLNSTGTEVQIRSAPSANPARLEDTTVLKGATPLRPGENTIKVDSEQPVSYLLVWVSTLGQVNGESRSDIAEITVRAAE